MIEQHQAEQQQTDMTAVETAAGKAPMIAVEVRGSRTKGALPASLGLCLAETSTVSDVKEQLVAFAQTPHTLTAAQITLVHAGRALPDTETLSLVAADSATPGELTLHAIPFDPSKHNAAPTPVKVASISASPVGPSPQSSPRSYSSQPGSFTTSPGRGTNGAESPGLAASPQWVEGLKRQVQLNMRKAFFDCIEKALSDENPDPEWITRLYAEMRDKLCALTPRRTDIHLKIHAALNVDLFEQMVMHKAFDQKDLAGLVVFVYDHLQGLCSPSRDAEVRLRREELEAILATPDVTFAKFAVSFLKGFHATIEDIEHDVAEFRKIMKDRPRAANSANASAGASPGASVGNSPAAASGVRELKAKLRQMGVGEEVLKDCVEKRELETLLDSAMCRVSGTVSGGISHRSLINKGESSRALHFRNDVAMSENVPTNSNSANLAAQEENAGGAGALSINFKVMQRGGGKMQQPLDTTMQLAIDTTAAKARVAIARVLGFADEGCKLVFAGRVLSDDESLSALLAAGEAPLQIYVVPPR